jgi:hypothetical protein
MTKTLFSVQIGCSPIMSESCSQSEGEIHVLPVATILFHVLQNEQLD